MGDHLILRQRQLYHVQQLTPKGMSLASLVRVYLDSVCIVCYIVLVCSSRCADSLSLVTDDLNPPAGKSPLTNGVLCGLSIRSAPYRLPVPELSVLELFD
jgi:hypothetical protein